MRYEVTPEDVLEIYEDGADVPFVRQPNYPNGEPWESKTAAEEWAQIFIDGATGVSNLVPPNGPGEEPVEMTIPDSPHVGWTWDTASRTWQAPHEAPNDGSRYGWNDETQDWEKLPTLNELLGIN